MPLKFNTTKEEQAKALFSFTFLGWVFNLVKTNHPKEYTIMKENSRFGDGMLLSRDLGRNGYVWEDFIDIDEEYLYHYAEKHGYPPNYYINTPVVGMDSFFVKFEDKKWLFGQQAAREKSYIVYSVHDTLKDAKMAVIKRRINARKTYFRVPKYFADEYPKQKKE